MDIVETRRVAREVLDTVWVTVSIRTYECYKNLD